MRVLHLIKSLGRGGAEVLLAEGLAVANRAEFDFSYAYFLPWKDALVEELRGQRAEVTCFSAASNGAMLASTRRVALHLREHEVDLVHAHLPMAGVVARLAGRMAGVPVVYTEHNLQERYRAATRLLNRWSWTWQERAIAVSAEVAESIAKNIGERVPVQTVLNGVNVDKFRRSGETGDRLREGLRIPAGVPVVGSIAVFRKQKRLDHWLQVARRVADRVPAVQFLLVGEGPERERVERSIGELGLADRVHLPGLQEDVLPYLAVMDVYLMTSEFEGLPIALLEAMAMETAPVVTAVGGIPEVICSERNGLLRKFADVEGLADDVVRLAEDRSLRNELARAARETVVKDFSMQRMQGELEDVYRQVLQRSTCDSRLVVDDNYPASIGS